MHKEAINGYNGYHRSFMCKSCYNTLELNSDVFADVGFTNPENIPEHIKHCVSYSVEFHLTCPYCSNNMVHVDSGILKIVSMLNKKGYYTNQCGEGHRSNPDVPFGKAYIHFSHSSFALPNIPEGFSVDRKTGTVLATHAPETEEEKKICIDNLGKWAKSLPSIALDNLDECIDDVYNRIAT